MIHWLSQRIADYCADGMDTDREIITYGLECRISDIVQVAVLAVLCLTLRCMMEIFCFSLCFTALKRQVGGYHFATHLSCITIFSFMAVAVSKLAQRIPAELGIVISLIGMASVLVIVIRRAPVAHPNHPKSEAAHEKSKKASVRLAVLGVALLPLVAARFPTVGMAGTLGGLLAAVSLVAPVKNVNKKGGKVDESNWTNTQESGSERRLQLRQTERGRILPPVAGAGEGSPRVAGAGSDRPLT